mmetsp:Transcript_4388/g.14184  ORF Transcript_4388/g.14184 Transcript_4388/m.14184 type:complete len:350 (-) Transcript_4388:1009-2058(-)
MRLKVLRERSSAVSTSSRLERISTKSAASIATSVPAPMAIPRSACASAGESLTPSPTMATTTRPPSCSSCTLRDLPSGGTSESTLSHPTSRAMAMAVRRLSPVTMCASTPIAASAAKTPAASGLMGSDTANMPATAPPTATSTQVRARPWCSARNDSAAGVSGTCSASSMARLPTTTRLMSPPAPPLAGTRHLTPLPATAKQSSTLSAHGRVTSPPGDAGGLPGAFCCCAPPAPSTWSANVTIARPTGCSLPSSHEAATASSSSAEARAPPSASSCAVTVGLPWVMVPVLSNTTALTWCARSMASPPLMRMPLSAPTPVPTMTAVGVARPSAQGQAMTRTEMPKRSAKR